MTCWCDEAPPPLLLDGIAQFNRGEYFAQHETLEPLWRAEVERLGPVRLDRFDWRLAPTVRAR